MNQQAEAHAKEQEKHLTDLEKSLHGSIMRKNLEELIGYFQGSVLDVGCGDGYGMELLKRQGLTIEGLDISPSRVALARERGLTVVQAPQEEMPFKDKQFDTLLSSHTLEHCYDVDKALKEYVRVSKRGILIVPYDEYGKELESHTSAFHSEEEIIDRLLPLGKLVYKESAVSIMPEVHIVIDWNK